MGPKALLAALVWIAANASCHHGANKEVAPTEPPRAATNGEEARTASLELSLFAHPSDRLTLKQLDEFQLNIVARNLGDKTIDPELNGSTLLLNGIPLPSWPMTIGNGPRDDRWTALPAGDALEFGYAFRGSLFSKPGRYTFVLKAHGSVSKLLTVHLRP